MRDEQPAIAARLVTPSVRYRESFLEALAEYHAEGRHLELRLATLHRPGEFERYVESLRADAARPGEPDRYVRSTGAEVPWGVPQSGYVAQTILWWCADGEYLGRIGIRHNLNADLMRHGGNIGYEVRPSARRRGHATAMLAAALPLAAEFGMDRARIDCDAGNDASRRVIEKNGGVLDEVRDGSLFYWVPTR